MDATGRDASIAIPPAPNWYGSALGDWGGAYGTLYAYAARNAVVLVRPEETRACRRFVGSLVGHVNRVTALCFAKRPGVTHLLVSGSADTNLRLWDTTSRRCLRTMRGHTAEVSALSVSPVAPDLCVSGDRGGKCLVWRFGTAGGGGGGGGGGGSRDGDSTLQRPVRALEQLDGTPVLAVAMSAARENDVAVGHQSGALGVADVSASSPPRRLPARAAEVQCLAWMPSAGAADPRSAIGLLAVGSRERAVTLWSWDGERTSLRMTLPLPRCPPHLSEAQRGRLWVALAWAGPRRPGDVSGIPAGDAHVTPADDDAPVGTPDEAISRLVVASHGGELLRCDVPLLDGATATTSGRSETPPIREVRFSKFAGDGHSKTVFGISVRDGLAVTTSLDRSLAAWDVGKLARRWSAAGLGGFAYHAAVDPEDPRRVAVACGDGSVRAHVLADTDDDPNASHDDSGGASTVLWRGLPQTKATRLAWRPADGPADGREDGGAGAAEAGCASLAVGLEDGRVVALDPAYAGRHATQRDCHAGPVTGAQWVRVPGGFRELVTLGGGRLWRWVSLAAPAGRRRGGGGDGGAFVDVTMRFHDAATAEGATVTSFDFAEHEAAASSQTGGLGLPAAAVGWSDGTVTAHARDDAEPGDAFAFRVAWRAAEHSKAVTAVRWHPSAFDPSSPRHAWLGSVSADGGFLVYDARDGETTRSAPPSRRSLADLAWRPRARDAAEGREGLSGARNLSAGGKKPLDAFDASDAIAVTAGADGVVRGWDLSGSPAPAATMRGHEGRALFAAWAGAGAARRARGAPTATLVTGSDDQTVRAWEVDDPSHSPAAEAEAAARAKEAKEAKKLARDAEARREGEKASEGVGDALETGAKADPGPAASTDTPREAGTDPAQGAPQGASSKKKRKGTGGRGIVKPPPWESTPEGIAAGRDAAVRLARLLARRAPAASPGVPAAGAPEPLDDASAGYGPRGLGLYLGQEEAMRLLRLEESAVARSDGAGGAGSETAGAEGGFGVRRRSAEVSSSDFPGSGALRPPERAAAAALFRGDFHTASESLFAAYDGPIPPDFLAALVGGGRALYASAARAQADRLEARGEHQRAAVLRLSLHDVRGAIASLRRGGLERDAAALAAARLLPIDPLLAETRVALAAAEETRGGAEAAAKAHLSAGRVGAAVRALARPGAGGARAAAEVALVMGARGEPEKHAVIRAAKDAAARGDVADAADVLERWTERGVPERPAGFAGAGGGRVQGGGGGGGEGDAEIRELLGKIRISLEHRRETAESRDDGPRDVAGAEDE